MLPSCFLCQERVESKMYIWANESITNGSDATPILGVQLLGGRVNERKGGGRMLSTRRHFCSRWPDFSCFLLLNAPHDS